MNKVLGCVLLAITGISGQAVAQEAAEPSPAPIITQPNGDLQWRMTVQSPRSTKKDPASGKQDPDPNAWEATILAYTHTDKLTRVEVTYKNGSIIKYWRLPSLTLCENAPLHKVDIITDGGNVPAYPCASDGFYGMDHVKASDDQGVSNVNGVKVHVFRGPYEIKLRADQTAPPPIALDAKLRAVDPAKVDASRRKRNTPAAPSVLPTYEAWFDVKTGLPRVFRENLSTYYFEFSDTAPAKLQLPEQWQAALEQFKKNRQRAGMPVNF